MTHGGAIRHLLKDGGAKLRHIVILLSH